MPVLEQERLTKKVILPSFPEEDPAWVEIYEEILAGDILEISEIQNAGAQSSKILSKVIAKWNLTDKEGNIVPITEENVRKLPIKDMLFIIENVTAFKDLKDLSDKKKENSSVTTPQSKTS